MKSRLTVPLTLGLAGSLAVGFPTSARALEPLQPGTSRPSRSKLGV